MLYILIVVIILICVLLALFVLIQEPKGGGLSSGFSGSNNIMGVQRTSDILEKGTWVLIVSLMVVVLLVNVIIPKGVVSSEGEDLQNQINKPVQTAPLAPAMPQATDTTKK